MKVNLITRWCWRGASVAPSQEGAENVPSGNSGRGDAPSYTSQGKRSQWRTILTTVGAVTLIGVVAYLCRDYVRKILLWMAVQEVWVVILVFLALFTIVSFPFTWGYIIINIAAGYMFGTWMGLGVTICTVTMAVIFVHTLIRGCLKEIVHRQVLKSRIVGALLTVLAGSHAFKVIAVTRLTPIPFGLQNAVFAVSGVPTLLYMTATVLGLLPTQILNCYLGTTVRNLQDVVSDTSSATATGWIVFSVQIAISVALTVWVIRRAKAELHKTMEAELTQSNGNSPVHPNTPPNMQNGTLASNGATNLALVTSSPSSSAGKDSCNTSSPTHQHQGPATPISLQLQLQQNLNQTKQNHHPLNTPISHPHSPLTLQAPIVPSRTPVVPRRHSAGNSHFNFMTVSSEKTYDSQSYLSPSHNWNHHSAAANNPRYSVDICDESKNERVAHDSGTKYHPHRSEIDNAVLEAGNLCISTTLSSTSCISFGREISSLTTSKAPSRRQSSDDELILLGALDHPA